MKRTRTIVYESPWVLIRDLPCENVICASPTGSHESFEIDDDDNYEI